MQFNRVCLINWYTDIITYPSFNKINKNNSFLALFVSTIIRQNDLQMLKRIFKILSKISKYVNLLTPNPQKISVVPKRLSRLFEKLDKKGE